MKRFSHRVRDSAANLSAAVRNEMAKLVGSPEAMTRYVYCSIGRAYDEGSAMMIKSKIGCLLFQVALPHPHSRSPRGPLEWNRISRFSCRRPWSSE